MSKVLVVGGGGREHAIIRKLSESKKVDKIYACPGNGGISAYAECVNIKASDLDSVVLFAKDYKIDMVVVAPDDPLVAGMVDALEKAGVRAFGPRANAAIIEGSKVFSKNLMKKYGIPTAGYEVFSDYQSAVRYIQQKNEYPVVIKADGLALGKGVIIAENFEQAKQAADEIMNRHVFGKSGNKVVVEEFLTGPEVSVLAFTDGKTVKPMVSSMDHKRAYDHDKGPNTGGMGTIAPNPYYLKETADFCMDDIFLKTIQAMQSEGRPFKGVLYFGLMLTPNGPRVIEYNCRFGDPETQVVLPLLQTDLYDIFNAVIDEKLGQMDIQWSNNYCACVVMASGGYPKEYKTGYEISGLDEQGQISGGFIYHAGTKAENGKYYTAGGRVLGVTARGESLKEAVGNAYRLVSRISFENQHFRRDIGTK